VSASFRQGMTTDTSISDGRDSVIAWIDST
jgi:hypothetical protein